MNQFGDDISSETKGGRNHLATTQSTNNIVFFIGGIPVICLLIFIFVFCIYCGVRGYTMWKSESQNQPDAADGLRPDDALSTDSAMDALEEGASRTEVTGLEGEGK